MVIDQGVDPLVQPTKRQPMAGQHEHIRRDRRLDVGQRAQINA